MATRKTDFNKGVGLDQYSIGYDGFNRVIFHNGARIPVDKSWKEDDIVGCLIDVPRKKFAFLLNGRKLKYKNAATKMSSPTQSHYVVVQLSPHQSCYFNFGQAGFKNPSRGIQYSNFHSESGEQGHKYHLLVPCQTNGSYWFKKALIDNQVDLFFRDEKQNLFDRWFIKLLCATTTDFDSQEAQSAELENEFTAD